MRPIEDNPIYADLRVAKALMNGLYQGRHHAVLFFGPSGIGKTTLSESVAAAHGVKYNPRCPGSKPGLIRIVADNRGGVVTIEDSDFMWHDAECLGVAKQIFDTRAHRRVSHDVFGANAVDRMRVDTRFLVQSNLNFNSPKDFRGALWDAHIFPVIERCVKASLSFTPIDVYEYCGHVATVGGMLEKLFIDITPAGKAPRRFNLPLAEQNEVLQHFHDHAARYPSLGPRTLEKFAKLRIQCDGGKKMWEAQVERNMSPGPIWTLPKDLHLFQVERRVRLVQVAAVPPLVIASVPPLVIVPAPTPPASDVVELPKKAKAPKTPKLSKGYCHTCNAGFSFPRRRDLKVSDHRCPWCSSALAPTSVRTKPQHGWHDLATAPKERPESNWNA
jgi:hypothetical protein